MSVLNAGESGARTWPFPGLTSRVSRPLGHILLPFAVAIGVLTLLELAILAYGWIDGEALPPAQYPLPHRIAESIWTNGSAILDSARPTIWSSCIGFAAGLVGGLALSVVMWWSKLTRHALAPYVALVPMLPVVAIAPLLTIMIEDPLVARIVLAGWVTCFPIIVNTSKGLAEIDSSTVELAATYDMSRWQELVKINFPNSLPHFFAGARIGATWSVIGSIVLEFTGNGTRGLGYLMLTLSYYGEGAQAGSGGSPEYFLWAVAVASALVGLLLYVAVVLVEWFVVGDRLPPEAR